MHDILHDVRFLKSQANIKVFKQFVKRLVLNKRHTPPVRSFLFIFFLYFNTLCAGFDDLDSGARSAGMAAAGVAWGYGAESMYLNPAGIFPQKGSFDVHLFYTNPYGLDDLSLGNVSASYARKKWSCGLALQNFGNTLYQENQFVAAVAGHATPKVVFGAALRYGSLSIKGYGESGALMVDLGIVGRLHKKLNWGFSAKNANNAKIGREQEPLPSVLTTGLAFIPVPNILLNFDVSKDTRFPMDLRCGVEYSPFSILALRVGVGNEPTRFCAGFSVSCFRFRVDYAFSSHADLGMTHLFSLGFF